MSKWNSVLVSRLYLYVSVFILLSLVFHDIIIHVSNDVTSRHTVHARAERPLQAPPLGQGMYVCVYIYIYTHTYVRTYVRMYV